MKRLLSFSWLIAPAAALVLVLWSDRAGWERRAAWLTAYETWSVDAPRADAESPTGYVGSIRQLVPPLDDAESLHRIMQTQQMLQSGERVIRKVDYENAPQGRPESGPSLYRWWLGLVAGLRSSGGGEPPGISVERAAIVADPILHVVLIVAATALCLWTFGPMAAGWVGASAAVFFPLSTAFLPGVPNQAALELGLTALSLLLIAAGAQSDRLRVRGRLGLFAAAGALGGVVLWLNPAGQLLVMVGVAMGGWLAASLAGRAGKADTEDENRCSLPWVAWGIAGALTTTAAWAVDYAPHDLGGAADRVHWLHAIGWLALAGVVQIGAKWLREGWKVLCVRDRVMGGAGALVVIGLLVAMAARGGWATLFAGDALGGRLTRVGPIDAPNLFAWIARDGLSGPVIAAWLPCLVLVAAAALVFRGGWTRLALPLGAAGVFLVAGVVQLRWWAWLDVALLAVIPGLLAAADSVFKTPVRRWLVAAAAVVVLAPGAMFLGKTAARIGSGEVRPEEAIRLVERDFAHWLAQRAGGESPIVLAPPDFTTALTYYGGVRGIASFNPQNEAGLAGAIRIVSAKNKAETLALIESRQVTHVVIPSWDPFLDELVRIGRGEAPGAALPRDSFLAALHTWVLPPWLRTVAYSIPPLAGFEGLSVLVFEVVDDQEDDEAAARLAEFFVETGRAEEARRMLDRLARFPASLPARAAAARVAFALRDRTGFETALADTVAMLDSADNTWLPWDQRVSLALLLADGKRMDLARAQLKRCLEEIDAAGIRSLSTVALARFLTLTRVTGMEIADAELRKTALGLLPPRVRERVGR